ncbi:hypothetical protein MPSEU_000308400 [Mayamaea pseudoterrestris]|nr:hypothetical protein MPSEU_000308400 [Mayamaea pseudoterrestris]
MAHQPISDGSNNAMSSVLGLYSSAKEKWDASGANEAVGRLNASIPDSTRTLVSSMFKREHLRSVSVVFGLGEERPFYVEKTPSLLVERLRHNMVFFYLNYMFITAILFCLTLLISPGAIIGIGLLAMAWVALIRASQSGSLRIGSISIPQKTATIGMGGVSIFVLLYILSNIFWWTLFSSGFIVAAHAFLRDASMHKDLDDAVAMEGDLNLGEDAAFLNAVSSDEDSAEIVSSLGMFVSNLEREACLTEKLGIDLARRLFSIVSELQVLDSIQHARKAYKASTIIDIMLDHPKNEPVQEMALKALATLLDEQSSHANVIGFVKMQLAGKKQTCYMILEIMLNYQTSVAIQTHGLAVLMAYPCVTRDADGEGIHIETALTLLTGVAQRIVMEAIWISTQQLGLESFMVKHDAWNSLLGRFHNVMAILVAEQQLNQSRDNGNDEDNDNDDDAASAASIESIVLLNIAEVDADEES